jgi:hypothetical protein
VNSVAPLNEKGLQNLTASLEERHSEWSFSEGSLILWGSFLAGNRAEI